MRNDDLKFLRRAVDLAKIALNKNDEPFGSILVSKDGKVLYEGHNEVGGGDHTRHPEFEIAKWAANNLSIEERKTATVYTSNEHCPMCSAAHGWVGLGRIVYAASSLQLTNWLKDFGADLSPVNPIPVEKVINNANVSGPFKEFEDEIKELHLQNYLKNK